ncbi:MAG: hypothetical protein ACXWJF_10655 [Burkholderiaceae bacterium]
MKTNQSRNISARSNASPASRRRSMNVCGGNKGGTGKSLIGTTVSSLLMRKGESVTVIEADPTNPDLARRFANHVPVLLADISDRDGWFSLLDALEGVETQNIVMSLPAGMNGIDTIASLLERTLKSLAIDLNYIFALSRQHDSVELAGKSLESGLAVFAQRDLAIRNGFFGRAEQFDRWDHSPNRASWLAKPNFSETYLPELNFRLVDLLESNPQPLHLLENAGLSTALRFDLLDWLNAAETCLAPILYEHEFNSNPVEDAA